ncbi:MAG TPA: hypothetical protein DCQ36_06545 [Actinobacteria bacterium]|jgi:hypothetical protein|nr:hypothetical protein [Actinomycetota bacterium]
MPNPPHPGQAALPSRLVQIAYRVDDLEAACHQWAESVGAGPFLCRSHLPVTARHDGQPAVYDHSAAFGQWGAVMLELIQLHECEPAAMREVLEHDAPGQANHFACFVDDLAAASAALEAQGMPLTMSLTTSSGMEVRFHDARHVVGGVLELYVGTEHLRDFYDKVAALAEGWDGSDVVRWMESS